MAVSSQRNGSASNGQGASSGVPSGGAVRTDDSLLAALVGSGLYPEEGTEYSIDRVRETLGTLWRGKWIILAVFVLVMAATGIHAYRLQDEYRTSALMLVQPNRGPTQQLSLQITGATTRQGQDALANELLVIRQSRELARRVAQRLQEIDNQRTTVNLPILRGPNGPLTTAQVAGRVRGRAQPGTMGGGTSAIMISATSRYPREAAAIAQTYAEEYIARTEEESQQDVRGSRQFLQEQAAGLRGRLDSLEDQVSDYMSRQGAAALDQETSRTVEQLSQLRAQRDEAELQIDMQRAAIEATQEELERIKPQLADRAASSVGAELSQVQQRIAERTVRLDQIYREQPALRRSPDATVRELRQELAGLRTRADSLANVYVDEGLSAGGVNVSPGGEGESNSSGISFVAEKQREIAQARLEINSLQTQIQQYEKRINEYEQKLRGIPEQSMELAQMQRARQSAERLYTFVVEKLQETRIAEESKTAYAEILSPAGVPGLPFRPDRRRLLMMGALLGLVLGGGLVILREWVDTRLRRPDDLEKRRHGLIGVIPDMTPVIEEDFDGAESITVDGYTFDTHLQMLLSPMSAAAEAYRRLRTNLQFSRPDARMQVLLVTSPSPGEGKTTTALNVAVALAQTGRRTLVVDADLRRPRVQELVHQRVEPGLSDVLFDQKTLREAVADSGVDDLYVLPAGSEVPRPAELLDSDKMHALLGEMREAYDTIVFDTPPVGAFSDGMLLGAQCDGAFLVASAGETDGNTYDRAAESLASVGTPLLGGVLNRFDERRHDPYGAGYGYGAQYREAEAYYDEERARPASGPAT